jgi:uncharacterized protein YqhQ
MSFADDDRGDRDDYDDYAGHKGQPHRGVVVLVMGILSLMFTCFIFGLIAYFMGKRDLDLMKRGLMDKEGEALTKVGYILGIVGSVISLGIIAMYALIIVIAIAAK